MPKLKAFVKSLDEVAEPLREFYEKASDGGYWLAAEGVEDVSGLKSALEKEREERRKAKEQLRMFEGVDPEAYRAWKAQREKEEDDKLKAKGEWEAREQRLIERHQAEIRQRDERIKALQRTMEQHLVTSQVTQAIVAAKGIPQLLLPHVERYVKVVEDNGNYSVQVVDEHGNPRIGDSKGNAMTIAQLVDEFKQNPIYGRAFEASGAGGSGASSMQNGGSSGAIRLSRTEALNAQIYQQAYAEAQKRGVPLLIEKGA